MVDCLLKFQWEFWGSIINTKKFVLCNLRIDSEILLMGVFQSLHYILGFMKPDLCGLYYLWLNQ